MQPVNRASPVRALVPLSDSALAGVQWINDIRELTVLDDAGYEMGRVADLVIDDLSHRLYFIVLRAAGVVLDGDERIIPVDAIRRRDRDRIWVDQDHEQVAAGPRYDRELIGDADYQAGVYGWYGLTPHWHPRYVSPPQWARR